MVTCITILPGAKQVRIGTYGFFGSHNPKKYKLYNLEDVSGRTHRIDPRTAFLRLKLRDSKSSKLLLVERRGFFPKPALFDRTVGMSRDF